MLQIYKVFIKNFFIVIGDCTNDSKHLGLLSKSCNCIFCNSYFDNKSNITQISSESLLYTYLNCNFYNLKFNIIVRSINPDVMFQNFKSNYSFIVAAGGVVLNEKDEILMIFKNNIWDLPKGKKDVLESDSTAAIREVNEETNVNVNSIVEGSFSTYHMYSCLQEKTQKNMILKETRWFLMHAKSTEKLRPQIEELITDVAWIAKSQISHIKTYDSVKTVLSYFFKII